MLFIATSLVLDHAGRVRKVILRHTLTAKGKITGGIDHYRHILWRGDLAQIEGPLNLGLTLPQVEPTPLGELAHRYTLLILPFKGFKPLEQAVVRHSSFVQLKTVTLFLNHPRYGIN